MKTGRCRACGLKHLWPSDYEGDANMHGPCAFALRAFCTILLKALVDESSAIIKVEAAHRTDGGVCGALEAAMRSWDRGQRAMLEARDAGMMEVPK